MIGGGGRLPLALAALLLTLPACAGAPASRAAKTAGTAVGSTAARTAGAAAAGSRWTWVDRFGGPGRNAPRAIAMAPGGEVYTVGQLAHRRGEGERSWSGDAAGELMFLARHAATGRREWLLRFGGSPVDEPRAVAVAPDATVLIAGLFAGELGFGSTRRVASLRSIGSADAFVLGVGPDGEPRWALSWGGKFADAARTLAVDAAGNVYVAGTFQLTADFDPGAGRTVMTSAGRGDGFVMKLDPARRLLWARRFGGVGTDEVTAVAVSDDGTVYFGGSTDGEWEEAGTGSESSGLAEGRRQAFVAALAPDGALRWARSFDAERGATLAGLAVGAGGALYGGGSFQGRLRFAGRDVLDDAAGWDVFLARLDAGGAAQWVREVGGETDRSLTAESLAATTAGPLLGGFFEGRVDFDPGSEIRPLETATAAGFLLALDPGGSLAWVDSASASGVRHVLAIAAGGRGRAAVAGVGQREREGDEPEADADREGEGEGENEGNEIVVLGLDLTARQ